MVAKEWRCDHTAMGNLSPQQEYYRKMGIGWVLYESVRQLVSTEYNGHHDPPHFVLTNKSGMGRPKGEICFLKNGTREAVKVGDSACEHYLNITPSSSKSTSLRTIMNLRTPNKTEGGNIIFTTSWMGDQVTKLTSYNGTYFIWGHKTYPWLPKDWTGSYYLGYVDPYIHHLKGLRDHHQVGTRHKRAITETQHFFGILIPPIGVALAIKEIRKVATVLEKVANNTTEALLEMSNEMVAIRTVALQNRAALDYLLASEGGTCAVIVSKCCT
ncbi:endogenous retrovirus group PABLB member 1 Env polyprotein-like [Scyliorhinus canicula]|uniref:endogenous retrovirus group PABLB member 1 Env polyprotein-like n=1 Tax=Scyliorhinus canicula TaxID=7830 RepID=UPI0018F309EA|nr:endogenous retrovirus group PABLB member 1 Env polyprotein-like [Scyliorhinus canicula]